MTNLSRVKKIRNIFYLLSAVSFVLTAVFYFMGGNELILDGYMGNELMSILTCAVFPAAVICLLAGLGFNAVAKDVADGFAALNGKPKSGK